MVDYSAKVVTARRLRKRATPSQRVLWELLRASRMDGHKFRRQHILLGWIVDFYCPEMKLAIEVNGMQTRDPELCVYRDAAMRQEGIRVLRFTHEQVLSELGTILDLIKSQLRGQ
jgi:very-short-patch-repair endonuclease